MQNAPEGNRVLAALKSETCPRTKRKYFQKLVSTHKKKVFSKASWEFGFPVPNHEPWTGCSTLTRTGALAFIEIADYMQRIIGLHGRGRISVALSDRCGTLRSLQARLLRTVNKTV